MKFFGSSYIVLLSCCLLLIFGCKKKSKNYSGSITDLKGNITLTVRAVHHTYTLPDLKVYLKQGATSYPGNDASKYDYQTTTNANGEAVFSSLPLGAVWVYATGTDTFIKRSVVGNTGLQISNAVVNNNKANLTLFVSE